MAHYTVKRPSLRQLATFLLALGSAVGIYLICVAAWQGVKNYPRSAAVMGAVLCLVCTRLLQKLKQLHLPHGWDFPPRLAGVALIGGMGIHWAATAVEHWLIELLHHHYGWLAFCGLALAAVSGWLAYLYRTRLVTIVTNRLDSSQERRPHLLWFLSTARNYVVTDASVKRIDGKWVLVRKIKGREGNEEEILPASEGLKALDVTLKSLSRQWNGHQLIRALLHQFENDPNSMTDLWVVASSGSDGSSAERVGLLQMLREVPEMKSVTIHPEDTPDGNQRFLVDFENMDQLQEEIINIIGLSGGGRKLTIDCTGGQKTTSIAAALATSNNATLIQYVQTQEPHCVLTYDCEVQIEVVPAGHH